VAVTFGAGSTPISSSQTWPDTQHRATGAYRPPFPHIWKERIDSASRDVHPAGAPLSMIFFAGLVGSLVIRMVGSSWPRPATASCRRVPGRC